MVGRSEHEDQTHARARRYKNSMPYRYPLMGGHSARHSMLHITVDKRHYGFAETVSIGKLLLSLSSGEG